MFLLLSVSFMIHLWIWQNIPEVCYLFTVGAACEMAGSGV